jgi:hypothetical protein
MADKKITALSERLVPIIGDDLLILVANVVPASAAANYKIQVKNFLANCQVALPNTAVSAFRITANVVANSTAIQSAAEFRLDAGNNAIGATKLYGAIINHTIANTSYSRCVPPVAFLAFKEVAGANTDNALATTFLFDAGLGGTANVSSNAAANLGCILCPTANAAAATHTVKVRINGNTFWLLASSVGPV